MSRTWPADQPVLVDDRLRLRSWHLDDVDAVFRACQDPEIQHFTQVPVPYAREHAVQFVTHSAQQWADERSAGFAVTDLTSGELLGACGLLGADLDARRTGAGYWVAPWARGRGVARRALDLVSRWALGPGGMACVFVEVEEENPASTAVAVATGFVVAGLPLEVVELKGTLRRYITYERRR